MTRPAGRWFVQLVGSGCLAVFPLAAQSHDDPWQISFRQLTPDIHLAYRPDPLRHLVEGNVTIIVNRDDVVVVDGSGSPRAARQVIDHIRTLTANPVTVLVNTHGHGDHTLGNEEYLRQFPGLAIIARPETREYLTGSGIDYVRQIAASTASRKAAGAAEIARLEREALPGHEQVTANLLQYYEHDIDLRQLAYRTVTITPPTVTFETRLVLHRPGRDIELRHLGAGDTAGDVVVFLPQDRLVIAGDLLVHPVPYGFSRHPLDWAVTLGALADLEFDTLVPGHGDVQHGQGYLRQVRTLLADVATQVKRAVAAGVDRDGIRAAVQLDRWRDAFAGDNPVLAYYFEEYFARPHAERTWDAITGRT